MSNEPINLDLTGPPGAPSAEPTKGVEQNASEIGPSIQSLGGKARAAKLNAKERSSTASIAAKARWQAAKSHNTIAVYSRIMAEFEYLSKEDQIKVVRALVFFFEVKL